MPTLREWVIELAVMAGIGVALAALGPFGSFELGGFGARLAYWVPATLIGYAIFRPITLAAFVIARRLDLPPIGAAIAGALVAAAPGTLAIAYLGGFRPAAAPDFDQLFQLYVQVSLIGALVMTIFILLNGWSAFGAGDPPAVEITHPSAAVAVARATFLNRLPPAWADRLIALEMEDHYVRAYGPDGSTLILLRMRDAEAELAGVDGMRIHRSWWVARAAVDKVVRDGRGAKLRLTNGIEAPVARDRVAALRAAGWFA